MKLVSASRTVDTYFIQQVDDTDDTTDEIESLHRHRHTDSKHYSPLSQRMT